MSGDEPDHRDETWCLYDGEIIDDELLDLWSGFGKGVRILVILIAVTVEPRSREGLTLIRDR